MTEQVAIELDYSTAAKCGHTQEERANMLLFILAAGANNLEADQASPDPIIFASGANNPAAGAPEEATL